jgi:hypothetical protein
LFFIVVYSGSPLPTDGGNVMGASCLHFPVFHCCLSPVFRDAITPAINPRSLFLTTGWLLLAQRAPADQQRYAALAALFAGALREIVRHASPVIRTVALVPATTAGYRFGLVAFGAPFWAARCTGILLKYASHVVDNSVR